MSVSGDFFLRRSFASFPLRSFFVSPTHENVDERRGQRTKSLSPLSFNNDSIVGNPLDTHTHTHTRTHKIHRMPREAFPQRDYISAIENVFLQKEIWSTSV